MLIMDDTIEIFSITAYGLANGLQSDTFFVHPLSVTLPL